MKESDWVAILHKDGNSKGFLLAYHFAHVRPKDTLVINGEFDSYIEEFFPVILQLRDAGYEVICFEGPGRVVFCWIPVCSLPMSGINP